MTKAEAIKLLKENKNDRGIANWKKSDPSNGRWTSYGIGLTQLKKIAKTIGKDHNLAQKLWNENNLESKTLAILIDDPKQVNESQVELQVAELGFWLISHSYCQTLMPKVSFVKEKTLEWIKSKDDIKRRCGYLTLCQLTKDSKKYDDEFFIPHFAVIEKKLQKEENFVKDAMNNFLYYAGMRSAVLNKKAVAVAKKVGKVEVDYGDNSCEAVNVLKHIQSDRIKTKFGIK